MAVARRIQVTNDASVPLPSFMFPGMPVGFIVADTTGQNWQLTASTATVDHTAVEACAGNRGLRWIAYSSGGGLGSLTAPVVKSTAGVASAATQGSDYPYLSPYDAIQRFALSAYPSLTGFLGIPLGIQPAGTTTVANVTTTSGALEGGSLKANNAGALTYVGSAWNQTPKTGTWFMAWRGKHLGGGVAAHDTNCSIVNAAGSHYARFGRFNATSSTKWTVQWIDNAAGAQSFPGTANADSLIHTLALGWDGTTLKFWVDPTVGAAPDFSQATTLNADEPYYPAFYSATVLENDQAWAFHGFVAP